MIDPYRTLRVNRSASLAEIQASYRKLVRRWHPDRRPGDAKAAEKFKEAQAAWELLGDAERRARYDATGDTSAPRPGKEQETATLLMQLAGVVLQKHAGGEDRWDGPFESIDLVAEINKSLLAGRDNVRESIRKGQHIKNDLESAVGRFIVFEDGTENILAGVARDHLAKVTSTLEAEQADLDQVERAIVHLKKFGYKVDFGRDTRATATITAMGLRHMIVDQSPPRKDGEY